MEADADDVDAEAEGVALIVLLDDEIGGSICTIASVGEFENGPSGPSVDFSQHLLGVLFSSLPLTPAIHCSPVG